MLSLVCRISTAYSQTWIRNVASCLPATYMMWCIRVYTPVALGKRKLEIDNGMLKFGVLCDVLPEAWLTLSGARM